MIGMEGAMVRIEGGGKKSLGQGRNDEKGDSGTNPE